jgi:hypothetical protein
MNAVPHTGSPLKPLRAARATSLETGWRIRAAFWHVWGHRNLQGAHTFRNAERMRHPWLGQEFMIKIKKAKRTQRDVRNEGCSHYVDENKEREYTNSEVCTLRKLNCKPI